MIAFILIVSIVVVMLLLPMLYYVFVQKPEDEKQFITKYGARFDMVCALLRDPSVEWKRYRNGTMVMLETANVRIQQVADTEVANYSISLVLPEEIQSFVPVHSYQDRLKELLALQEELRGIRLTQSQVKMSETDCPALGRNPKERE